MIIASLIGFAIKSVYRNPYTETIPLSLLAGVIGYYVVRGETMTTKHTISPKIFWIIFTSLSAIILFYYQINGNNRPPIIHVLIGTLFALSALMSLRSQQHGLLGVIITGLLQRFLSFFASPVLMGLDSQFHLRKAVDILQTGSLEPLFTSKYFYAPLYHINVSVFSHLSGLNERISSLVFIAIPMVCIGCIISYALGSRIFEPTAGVLSAVLFVSADYVIAWSVRTRPLSFALLLFPLVVFVLIRYLSGDDTRFGTLAIGFVGVLGLIHQSSHFNITVAIAAMLTIWLILKPTQRGQVIRLNIFLGSVLTGVWMVTKYNGPNGEAPSFLTVLLTITISRLQDTTSRGSQIPETTDFLVSGAGTLNAVQLIPLGLFLALTCTGALLCLDEGQERLEWGMLLLITVGTIAAAAFIGPLVGFAVAQPYRFFAFLYFLAGLLGGFSLYTAYQRLGKILPSKYASNISASTLFVFILFLSVTSGANFVGAPDQPYLDSPGSERFAITDQEAASFQFAQRFESEQSIIVADFVAAQILSRNPEYRLNARYYRYQYGSDKLVYDSPRLALYRPYAATSHGRYAIKYENRWLIVYSPIPYPSGSRIYANGQTEFFYSSR
jgi:hypothetical protein